MTFTMIIILAFAYLVLKWFKVVANRVICLTCGWRGKLNKRSNENGIVTLVLLAFGIVPGLIYVLTRSSQYHCPECGQHVMKRDREVRPKNEGTAHLELQSALVAWDKRATESKFKNLMKQNASDTSKPFWTGEDK